MSTVNYIDMDISMERMNDEIDLLDRTIGEHIREGVGIEELKPLARLRANLSVMRKELAEAMDSMETHDEVCLIEKAMEIDEHTDFDTESYMTGDSFISVDTVR